MIRSEKDPGAVVVQQHDPKSGSKEKRARDDRILFDFPTDSMTQHIKPIYIEARVDGYPMRRCLVDSGAVVNIMPLRILKRLKIPVNQLWSTELVIKGKNAEKSSAIGVITVQLQVGEHISKTAFFLTLNLLLGRDWIHSSRCVPSSLHQR